MKRTISIFGLATLLIGSGSAPITAQDRQTETPLSDRNADFAFSFYEQVLKEKENENIFVSPYSVSLALAMAYHGAQGVTKREMAEALSLEEQSDAGIQRSYRDLLKRLEEIDPKIQLKIANSLWARNGFEIFPSYLDMIRKTYGATAKSLDFGDPEASRTINEWVKLNTGGKIDGIVPDRIPELTIAYLINAIYFKAPWKNSFDKKLTRDLPFHLVDGKTIQHPYMYRVGNFRYREDGDFQAIRIPYGKNGTTAMYVFLPRKQSGLKEFHGRLSAKNWKRWRTAFGKSGQKVELFLPRFTLRYEDSLKNELIDLGMKRAFTGKTADFHALFQKGYKGENPFIMDVLHKTFIEVNEVGTEAAAVTSVEFQTKGMEPLTATMRVDRPFFCVIHDDATDTILFMGSVVNPAMK